MMHYLMRIITGRRNGTVHVPFHEFDSLPDELYRECVCRNISIKIVERMDERAYTFVPANDELSLVDMNSLNAIVGLLRCEGNYKAADVLLAIQAKATRMIKEREELFTFSKTVNVTNKKNILVQVPKAVAMDWGLEIGDKLEVVYNGNALTISPNLQRGRDASTQGT